MGFLDDVGVVERHDSRLRPCDQQAVARDRGSQGTQAVPIHASQHPSPVESAHRCRSVPWFHQAVVPTIEVAQRLRHARVVCVPRFRDEQASRLRQFSTEAQEHFEGGVDARGVGAVQGQDGFDLCARVAQSLLVAQLRLVACHPATVALQRVHLAVMCHDSKGLSQPPFGKGVGRETLMVDSEIRLHERMGEIGIKVRQLLCQKQSFVDHRTTAQGADVETCESFLLDGFFDSAPHHIEIAFELVVADSASVLDHDLFYLGTRRGGLAPQCRDDDRHLPPAVDAMSHANRMAFYHRATTFLLRLVAPRQEDHADGKPALLHVMSRALDMLTEELLRNTEMNSCAVAALAVGIDRAAMG